jgi:nucleoside-diphosphate-sugar epimerase
VSQLTGASGFLGSHIALQLLESGYRVRAYVFSFSSQYQSQYSGSAIRPGKIEEVKKRYARFADKFEAVPISDIVNDSFGDAFKGVNALIHTAASLPERASPEDLIKVFMNFMPGVD